MDSVADLRFHAIYVVGGDSERDLLLASIASIYSHVDRIIVMTGASKDWNGNPREGIRIAESVLSMNVDPLSKIDVILANETNEARSRNRMMDFSAPGKRMRSVFNQSEADTQYRTPDYFLIIDSDEIYENDHILQLKDFVSRNPGRLYRLGCHRYFKNWNYRVHDLEWAICVIRADARFRYLRIPPVSKIRRGIGRLNFLPNKLKSTLCGFQDVPPDVAVFHHGSYVGPSKRIDEKLASFGHSNEISPEWKSRIWDNFDPTMKNLNPAYPSLFPGVEVVSTSELPREISAFPWPDGYIERTGQIS